MVKAIHIDAMNLRLTRSFSSLEPCRSEVVSRNFSTSQSGCSWMRGSQAGQNSGTMFHFHVQPLCKPMPEIDSTSSNRQMADAPSVNILE